MRGILTPTSWAAIGIAVFVLIVAMVNATNFGDTVTSPATTNIFLEIPEGNVTGQTGYNKFGRSTNVDLNIVTDIWDRANATDDQDIWTAPTQARIHDIASSSASDDGDPAGVGARTIRIYGLTSWDTAEVSEDITLNGTTDVATTNSYVIIHRMQVLTKGATDVNVGNITATAQTDGTVTAQINASEGATQMAIYGVPSNQTMYIPRFYANLTNGTSGDATIQLKVNPEPNAEVTNFRTNHTFGIKASGTSGLIIHYQPFKKIEGPAIVKVQATGGANNMDVNGGWDAILVDN